MGEEGRLIFHSGGEGRAGQMPGVHTLLKPGICCVNASLLLVKVFL